MTAIGPDQVSGRRRRMSTTALRLQRLGMMGPSLVSIAVLVLLFGELALSGGDAPQIGLLFAALWLALPMLLLATSPWARQAIANAGYLQWPCLLFVGVLLWGLLQTTPLPFAPPLPDWALIAGRQVISLDVTATRLELFKLAALGAMFLTGFLIGRDDDRAHATWLAFGVMAGAYLAWSLYAHYQLPAPTSRDAGKLRATLGGANSAATLIAVFAVAAWTAILRNLTSLSHHSFSGDRLNRVIRDAAPWAALLVVSLGALSLTGSRGGAAAAGAGLVVATAVMVWGEARDKNTTLLMIGAMLIALFAFGYLTLSSGATATRLLTLDAALGNRQAILGLYIERLGDAPWTGFGFGSFARFNNLLARPGEAAVLWDLGALHNVVLQWIFEAGFVASALMFTAIGWVLALILGGLKRRKTGRTWIVGALGVSTVVLVHGQVDFGLQIPAIGALWALSLGCAVGVSRAGATRGAGRSA